MDKKRSWRILPLFKISAKMDLAWLLRDTGFALLAILSDLISNLSAISGVFLLAWRFEGIGGLSQMEVLFMLAYVNMVSGLVFMFGANNNLHISRIIGRGQLEHMFIQPLPIWVQLLTNGFYPFTCATQFLAGVGLMLTALWNLTIEISLLWILQFVGSIVLSSVLLIGLSYLFSSLAFYAPVQCEEISTYILSAMNQVSSYPLSGMPKSLQTVLVSLLPAGLLGWLPSLLLLGKSPDGISGYLLPGMAAIICLMAGYFFRKGMRYYVTKGINRYTSAGRN